MGLLLKTCDSSLYHPWASPDDSEEESNPKWWVPCAHTLYASYPETSYAWHCTASPAKGRKSFHAPTTQVCRKPRVSHHTSFQCMASLRAVDFGFLQLFPLKLSVLVSFFFLLCSHRLNCKKIALKAIPAVANTFSNSLKEILCPFPSFCFSLSSVCTSTCLCEKTMLAQCSYLWIVPFSSCADLNNMR